MNASIDVGTGPANDGPEVRRVLLVEDDHLIALVAADIMEEIGIDVLGPAASLETALSIARSERIDAAVLDVNLGADTSFAVARLLDDAGIPYFYTTAHSNRMLPELRDAPFLAKPYGARQFVQKLTEMLGEFRR